MKQEYLDVLWELQDHHSLFAQFWAVGHLTETEEIPTAAIRYDKEGRGLQFLINPDYWEQLNDHDKAFVIGHECLHAYFDHGQRSLGLDRELANLAQDVVINHYLVDVFGFKREKLTHGEGYCWIDTMFPDRDDVEKEKCFEYYYELLKKQGGAPRQGSGGRAGPQTVDSHEFLEGIDPETLEAIQEIIEDIADRMTPDEIENFEETIEQGNPDESDKSKQAQAGSMAGAMKIRIRLGRVIKKRKWETVVVDVLGRFGGMERDVDLELWTRDPRRLCSLDNDLILPAEVNETILVRDRIDVWFFQDVSGSCIDYAERFFRAAASIPDDRFRIRAFCFDTRVHEIDLKKGEVKGGGGTSFRPMEQRIQDIMTAEGCKYPQAVFVITDGFGNSINPEHPDRWHWFLTDYHSTHCIPSKSHSYKLIDYE